MQINPLPGFRFVDTFSGFFWGSVILDHRLTRLLGLFQCIELCIFLCHFILSVSMLAKCLAGKT